MFLLIIIKQVYHCCLLFISGFGCSGPVPFHQLFQFTLNTVMYLPLVVCLRNLMFFGNIVSFSFYFALYLLIFIFELLSNA